MPQWHLDGGQSTVELPTIGTSRVVALVTIHAPVVMATFGVMTTFPALVRPRTFVAPVRALPGMITFVTGRT